MHGSVRLTCAREVNDVFERHPRLIDDLNADAARGIFSRHFDTTNSSRSAILDYIRTKLIASGCYRKSFENDRFYCLSEPPDCVLMWGHYASSHRGLCVGFDTSASLFLQPLFEMQYSKQRPEVSATALLNASQGALAIEILKNILLTKYDQWLYEREWRFIGPHLQENNHALGHEWIDFDRGVIAEVIFRRRELQRRIVVKLIRSWTADLNPQPRFARRNDRMIDLNCSWSISVELPVPANLVATVFSIIRRCISNALHIICAHEKPHPPAR